jgi:uncharacterized repeat protein (TIGR03803 family)
MKTCIKNLFARLGGASCAAWVLPALIAGLGVIPAGRVTAQTFTTLHSFTNSPDGANPQARLILSGNTLYGTASGGGSSRTGTLFAVNTNGTGFTNLYSFTSVPYNNYDGANPVAGLILSGTNLYGTAAGGGSGSAGTVFKVNTNGTGFTILHSFTSWGYPDYTNSDGTGPQADLILSGTNLYGTASQGGSANNGTVFAVNTNGTVFTTLHIFTAGNYNASFVTTNSDGGRPYAGVILSGNTLYGTARQGGSWGYGTVFKVNTDGTGFTNLHSFNFIGGSDGAMPDAGVILSGNTLYGTASSGGSGGAGTVFAVNTDGTGYTNLHHFISGSDGAYPEAGMILSGNTLYGTASQGGSSGNGTVFAVHTDGTGFTNLYSFTATSANTNSDGARPYAGLILSGNTLYGTASVGGSSGYGTVFSLTLGSASTPPPLLTIIPSGANVILTWPTNAAGFTLQSTTNLVSPAVWSTVAPGPVVVNGQNAVTNPVSGPQQFYRLSQ